MRSIFLLMRQEMNTGSIGRSMNRMITQLRNPDQMMPAPNSTFAIGGVSSPHDSFVVAESFDSS